MAKGKKPSGERKGRPPLYTPELAEQICTQLATRPVSLKTVCRELGCDHTTVYGWLFTNELFANQYARARDAQADLLAEEVIEISDDSSRDVIVDKDGNESCNTEFVQRSRLRVDSRKWLASKLKPKKYGDALKLDATVDLKVGLAEKLAKADARSSTES